MLAAAGAVEDEADDHVRTNRANHPHVVAENFLLAPLLERLLDAERVAEVDGAGEVLLRPVELVGAQQLLGSQHRQRFEQLRSDLVLTAFAARGGDERRAIPHAVAVVRQHPVVLVVGMRRRHHQIADGVELAQHQFERGLAAQGGHRLQPMLRTGRDHGGDDEDENDQRATTDVRHGQKVPAEKERNCQFPVVSFQFKGLVAGSGTESPFELATGNWKLTKVLETPGASPSL